MRRFWQCTGRCGEYIGEGVDISCLKVSDITARAGIGKGTAYEYFRSKDELVECALNYHFMMRYSGTGSRATENQKTLREAAGKCVEWIEKNFGSREILWQCARAFRQGDPTGTGRRQKQDGGEHEPGGEATCPGFFRSW